MHVCALLVQFKPRELLNEIVGTWLHLAHDRTFLEKVASDERSVRERKLATAESTRGFAGNLVDID